jgi:GTP-binding protein HflX
MTVSTAREKPRALLVGIRTPELDDSQFQGSLEELGRLVTTLGFEVCGVETQRMPNTTGATGVGKGKLEEIAKKIKGEPGESLGSGIAKEEEKKPKHKSAAEAPPRPTHVVFDCDLKPSQLRHIEGSLGCEVLDRTGVIIEIFSRHARSRESRLQVEIARLNYLSPRIREVGSSGERQSGRGSGESALSIGRREIRDELAQLRKELEHVQATESKRRATRSDQLTVALVGYTNAGKSSTMRALTGSEVLVEDKLFATLDTTVRALQPETQPRVLVSDTVGFIKKLPHDLVASFRSTFDEALNASLLLHLVDASDPDFRSQIEVVDQTLEEAGAGASPTILVLNKCDLVSPEQKLKLKIEFPGSFQLSAQDPESVAGLRAFILKWFETNMQPEELFVPWGRDGLIGEIRRTTRVLRETHEQEGTRFTVRAEAAQLDRLRKRLAQTS